jgi:hypothetical protein
MERRGSPRRSHPGIFEPRLQSRSSAPTGPVYLALPSNLLGEPISVANPEAERSRVSPRIAGDPEAFADAVKLLAQAKRPLIVAGSAIAKCGAAEEFGQARRNGRGARRHGTALFVSLLSNHAPAEFSDRRTATVIRSARCGASRISSLHRLPLNP